MRFVPDRIDAAALDGVNDDLFTAGIAMQPQPRDRITVTNGRIATPD